MYKGQRSHICVDTFVRGRNNTEVVMVNGGGLSVTIEGRDIVLRLVDLAVELIIGGLDCLVVVSSQGVLEVRCLSRMTVLDVGLTFSPLCCEGGIMVSGGPY